MFQLGLPPVCSILHNMLWSVKIFVTNDKNMLQEESNHGYIKFEFFMAVKLWVLVSCCVSSNP